VVVLLAVPASGNEFVVALAGGRLGKNSGGRGPVVSPNGGRWFLGVLFDGAATGGTTGTAGGTGMRRLVLPNTYRDCAPVGSALWTCSRAGAPMGGGEATYPLAGANSWAASCVGEGDWSLSSMAPPEEPR